MITVCAWCKKEMRDTPAEDVSEGMISHGICEECVSTFFGYTKVELMDYLDRLGAPVLVVNSTGTVECANLKALEVLNKEMQEVEGFKDGDVFECAYAKLPEGCGHTIHCDACTIRITVTDTFQTGKRHINTQAYLAKGTPGDIHEIKLLISTENVAGVVLLRIDKIGEVSEW